VVRKVDGKKMKGRIAVVEDDADAREVIAELLRDEGYDVLSFGDAAEAFAKLRGEAPPDLILLDLRLPGMDGWEFRVQQKRDPRLAQTPVIALSADQSAQALAIDADEFLPKPPRLDALLETVASVLARDAEKRRRSRELILQSMAAVGQLCAGVAHEINNPLAYVSGNLHVLREELLRLKRDLAAADVTAGASFDDMESMIADSVIGAERIRDIVRDLRLLARVDDPDREPVELVPVLDSAINVAQKLAPAGRTLVVRRYDETPRVRANQGQLTHAFLSLVANALQAVPAGREGEVVVETDTTPTPERHVRVRVKDNGTGISPSNLGRIFEPFFTTRAIGAGRGLGLPVSQGIIAAHGGSLEVQTTVGRGTTVTVTLPPDDTR
jgi:signal transduction histidine kinase